MRHPDPLISFPINTEVEAGVLTDAASAAIKNRLRSGVAQDLDKILAPYFSSSASRIHNQLERGVTAVEGDTRYRHNVDSASYVTYKSKSGTWNSIFGSTIQRVSGEYMSVGTILNNTYAARGYEINKNAHALARTQYRYRYPTGRGQVYHNDESGYQFYTHAMSVSRTKVQAEYGEYTDPNGDVWGFTTTHNATSLETLTAPHETDGTFLCNKAYNCWKYSYPAFYEDWND